MEVVCHRGCPGSRPENSLPAVRAVPTRVDAIEIDVQQCASGEPVVVHDRTLDRTTDRSGAVAGVPLAALESAELEGTAATVPTLESVVAAVPAELGLTVELKHAGQFEAVAPILTDAGNEVRLSSFVPQALTPFAEAGFETALLVDPREIGGWDPVLAAADSIDADGLHAHYETIGRAIENRHVDESMLMSCVGSIRERDSLAQAADRLLELESITVAIVYGYTDETIHLSGRARSHTIDLGERFRMAFDDIGSAGGHESMAGAQIPLGIFQALESADEQAELNGIIADQIESRFEAALAEPLPNP